MSARECFEASIQNVGIFICPETLLADLLLNVEIAGQNCSASYKKHN